MIIYIDRLIEDIQLYSFCSGMNEICDSKTGEKLVTRKLDGLSHVKLVIPPPHSSSETREWNENFKATKTVCKHTTNISRNYDGCLIKYHPDEIFRKHYLHHILIDVNEFLIYAKTIGFDVGASFIEEIMSKDASFCEQVRLSRLLPKKSYNLNQLTSKYLANLQGVLSDTINQAGKQAAERYLSTLQDKEKREDVVSDRVYDIGQLFTSIPITDENKLKLRDELPDAWEKEIFGKGFIDTVASYSSQTFNNSSTREQNNLYRTIGLLAKALVTVKGNRFGQIDKPNINQLSIELSRYLPDDIVGLSDRSIRERLKKGLKSIE